MPKEVATQEQTEVLDTVIDLPVSNVDYILETKEREFLTNKETKVLVNIDEGGPAYCWETLIKQFSGKQQKPLNSKRVEKGQHKWLLNTRNTFVDNASHFYYDVQIAQKPFEEIAVLYPAYYNALLWYRDLSHGSTKWLIEAMFMANYSIWEICKELKTEPLPMSILAYKQLFFNVTDKLDNKPWLFTHIWSKAEERGGELILDDLFFKVVAYKLGTEVLKGVITYGEGHDEAVDQLRSIFDSQIKKTVLQLSSNSQNISPDDYMTMTQIVNDKWEIAEKDAKEALLREGEINTNSFDKVADAMASYMCIMPYDAKMDAKEQVNVPVYTEADLIT